MKGGRHHRQVDGTYHLAGKKFELLTGSRAQVWHGTAHQTTGGLTKSNLMQNKNGRIVSKRKHNTAKKENRLKKYGWTAKKGKFGAVRIGKAKRSRTRRRRRGKSAKVRRVSIREKRNIRTGRFTAGRRHRR